MDSRELIESDYVNVEIVSNSPTKRCVIISDVSVVDSKFGEKVQCLVEMDGKQKKLRLNKKTIENLQKIGFSTESWVGNILNLQVKKIGEFNAVIGEPDMSKATQRVA